MQTIHQLMIATARLQNRVLNFANIIDLLSLKGGARALLVMEAFEEMKTFENLINQTVAIETEIDSAINVVQAAINRSQIEEI